MEKKPFYLGEILGGRSVTTAEIQRTEKEKKETLRREAEARKKQREMQDNGQAREHS